jgi:hypothetical protein
MLVWVDAMFFSIATILSTKPLTAVVAREA